MTEMGLPGGAAHYPNYRVVTYLRKKGLEMEEPLGNKDEGLDRKKSILLEEDKEKLDGQVPRSLGLFFTCFSRQV